MISYEDFVSAFNKLGIPGYTPVISHASLSAFGEIRGGADSLLGALLDVFETLVMPGFTYKTMVVPQVGPPENGLNYGSNPESNFLAEFFHPRMEVDRLMGRIPQHLQRHPGAQRSTHPILSLLGVNAESFLDSQTLKEPLMPILKMMEAGGWVLLLGVDHTVNTSIHLGERLAGRKQFVRWALTKNGIVECPGFPGCSDGFNDIEPRLVYSVRKVCVGNSFAQAIPLEDLINAVKLSIEKDPLSLLCDRSYCERCQDMRKYFEKM